MVKKEEYSTSGHASECSDNIPRAEQYKIDIVINKMKKSDECRDIIYQFAIGIN